MPGTHQPQYGDLRDWFHCQRAGNPMELLGMRELTSDGCWDGGAAWLPWCSTTPIHWLLLQNVRFSALPCAYDFLISLSGFFFITSIHWQFISPSKFGEALYRFLPVAQMNANVAPIIIRLHQHGAVRKFNEHDLKSIAPENSSWFRVRRFCIC